MQWVHSPKSGHGNSHSSQQQRIMPNFTSDSTFEPVSTFHFTYDDNTTPNGPPVCAMSISIKIKRWG